MAKRAAQKKWRAASFVVRDADGIQSVRQREEQFGPVRIVVGCTGLGAFGEYEVTYSHVRLRSEADTETDARCCAPSATHDSAQRFALRGVFDDRYGGHHYKKMGTGAPRDEMQAVRTHRRRHNLHQAVKVAEGPTAV